MPKKTNYIIVLAILISLTLIFLVMSLSPQNEVPKISPNVAVENGKQIIEINAKIGGYYPRITYAKKNLDSILKIISIDSYGCERAFSIPTLNISKELPTDGTSKFELGPNTNSLLGTCSMGMYTFLIKFI